MSQPLSMRERAARAFFNSMATALIQPERFDDLEPAEKALSMTIADAVLEAMQEPSHAVMDAMQSASDGYDGWGGHWGDVWTAAIDAAIKEGEE